MPNLFDPAATVAHRPDLLHAPASVRNRVPISGQRMAIDASLIEADANKQNSTPKEDWDAADLLVLRDD